MTTVTYYLTLNSPWSYMGSRRFADIAKRHGATVDVKPAKFGEIFSKTGGLPLPKRSPERRAVGSVGSGSGKCGMTKSVKQRNYIVAG